MRNLGPEAGTGLRKENGLGYGESIEEPARIGFAVGFAVLPLGK
jgi:hypothetical protein